jgi:hypothetical protein
MSLRLLYTGQACGLIWWCCPNCQRLSLEPRSIGKRSQKRLPPCSICASGPNPLALITAYHMSIVPRLRTFFRVSCQCYSLLLFFSANVSLTISVVQDAKNCRLAMSPFDGFNPPLYSIERNPGTGALEYKCTQGWQERWSTKMKYHPYYSELWHGEVSFNSALNAVLFTFSS